jgi:hypothetical protein
VTAQLGKVLTIPEVAAIAGWHRKRMWRHLVRVHRETGGMLLRNIGTEARPRWTVTLAALQRSAPEWFTDPETVQARLDALEAEVKTLRHRLATMGQVVAEMTAA